MEPVQDHIVLPVSIPRRIQVAALTHKGLQRETNEDCVGVAGWLRNVSDIRPLEMTLTVGEDSFVMVADGVGGHVSGSLASEMAVANITQRFCSASELSEDTIATSLHDANRHIWHLLASEGKHRGAGTTIAGIVFGVEQCFAFNVGDSRIYRRQEQFLQLLTTDDRLDSERIIQMIPGAASSNILLQALGGSAEFKVIQPHVVPLTFISGDEFLLCTDGLSDTVSLDQMEQAITDNLVVTVSKLQELAFKGGAPDNISILYLRVT
jgi:serine/threonine protein phosphatase PrpC